MPTRNARLAAGITSAIAWAALALQLVILAHNLMAQGHGLAFALWRYVAYFTILTNLAVAVVTGAMALRPEGRLAGPRPRLAVTVAILIVGIVYSVALRHHWRPEGWQTVADHALHDVTPLLALLCWFLFPHGALRWRDGFWAAAPALLYCVYAFARGAADGFYAYWFFDPDSLPLGFLAWFMALLLCSFILVGMVLVAADRALARRALKSG